MLKHRSLFVALAFGVAVIGSSDALADKRSEQRKIRNRFEVVSFSKTQSFVQTILRIFEGAAETYGVDPDGVSAYEKRYRDLKLHWDDAKEKFKKEGVDWKKDTIYFGYIDWIEKENIAGVKVPVDHKIQFYVAARKRHNTSRHPLQKHIACFKKRANKSRKQRWELYDVDNHQHAIQNVRDRESLLDYAGSGEPYQVALFKEVDAEKANRAQRWLFLEPKTKRVVGDVKEGKYIIKNVRSGKVLDYAGDQVSLMDLEKDKTSRAQVWQLRKTAKRTFVISNVRREKEKKAATLDYKDE